MLSFGSEELVPFIKDEFPASVLGVYANGDTYAYTWQEQTWDPVSGQKLPMIGGRNGTLTRSPAYETNNQLIEIFPVNVKMKMRGGVGISPVFEFLAPSQAGEDTVTITIVTNICAITLP